MIQSNVLVINCGSSSVKFALIDAIEKQHMVSGLAERLGEPEGTLTWTIDDDTRSTLLGNVDHAEALEAIVSQLRSLYTSLADDLVGVGHRVVHGGEAFTESALIDDHALAELDAVSHLAPLHNPANVLGIQTARDLFPELPQVAVFDTAFHQSLPQHAYLYALPYDWYTAHGVRRYGFHGTSHRYVTRKAADLLGRPYEALCLLSAHLGNGCSAAAVREGRSVDTTMGLTPLEGLVMGTRSGDVDPSLHEFLSSTLQLNLDQITTILNKKSGLLGLSGLSNDMRTVEQAAAEGHERSQIAIAVFCYRLAKYLAALAVPLGRIDALIFTGGIGENSTLVRHTVLDHLNLLGFQLDEERNQRHGAGDRGIITNNESTVAMVVPTDEETMIALDTFSLIQ